MRGTIIKSAGEILYPCMAGHSYSLLAIHLSVVLAFSTFCRNHSLSIGNVLEYAAFPADLDGVSGLYESNNPLRLL